MPWDRLPALPTFEKARRREIYRKLASAVARDDDSDDLLSLEEVRNRLRIFDQRYVGIEPIRVDEIVGTVDRRPEFAKGFLPRDFETRERWRRVEQAFPMSDFPPIVVYRVDEACFVVDGHHRVGIAKQRGVEFIDAEVTELQSRQPLGPDIDLPELIHREQQRIFMEESGLDRARPTADIQFSRPLGYVELLDLVKVYGFHLVMDSREVLPREEIAARWYDEVYVRELEEMKREGLLDAFPEATDADLFLWVHQRRQQFFPEHGGMTLQEAARRLKGE
ncbi:MAG: hypothetical protein KY391_07965 [Actinobacteria bacterium]|nr:hypothetical protein [Actinomycetota bacterium]